MGSGPVLNFWRDRAARSYSPNRDWTQPELAQFYRVEWALSQAGISVDCDRGISDEGDPWFAFCRASDAEVVIHIAREGDTYILAGFLTDRIQRGRDFGDLVERLLAQHPSKTIDKRGQTNVVMHPATLLALLVSIAFLHSTDGKATSTGEHAEASTSTSTSTSPLALATAPAATAAVVAPRIGPTLANAVTPLAASFELTQAMTILRVASLISQIPIDQALATESRAGMSSQPDDTRLPTLSQSQLSQRDGADSHALDNGGSSAAQAAAGHLSATQAGVEKLLEVVAKLWTFPDAGPAVQTGLGVSAALAFFGSKAAVGDDVALTLPEHQQTRSQADDASALDNQSHARAADQQAAAPSTVTIVHTPGSSDTTAQTIMKLAVTDQTEIVLKSAALGSSAKIYSIVSDIVEHAKSSLSADSGAAILGNGKGELEFQSGARADDASRKMVLPVDDAATKAGHAADAATDDPAYTTVIGKGMVTHNVLDNKAEVTIERAIAAFKEDAGAYSVAVAGKDVIFYNADAVINHSTEVVVELWQFKDGSSISLVGISVDGHLPYSL